MSTALAASLTAAAPVPAAQVGRETAGTAPRESKVLTSPRTLDVRLGRDLSVFLGTLAVYVGSEVTKARWASATCRICAPGSLDRRARSWLKLEQGQGATRALSNVTTFAVLPAVGLLFTGIDARGHGPRRWLDDALVVGQATTITAVATALSKAAFSRQRPYAHFADAPIPFDEDPAQNLSMWSGHTSMAFAIATSTATTLSVRRSKASGWAWGVGMPLAALAGWTRVAADRHYVTDVLVGGAVGALIGGTTALLHRPRARHYARILPAPNGAIVTGTF